MKLLKEWKDVEATTKELLHMFSIWRYRNLNITKGNGSMENIFGFPYTSSSEYAAIWNAQGEAEYRWSPEWKFEALAVSENNDAIAVFEHEDGTVEKLDRMFVIIGKVNKLNVS